VQIELARLGWGRDDPTFRRFFTSSFIPDAPAELWEAFAELLRRTTSAENAACMIETWSNVDVVDVARRLDLPTLILHARGDLRAPFEGALELGTLIRGSRVVPLDSANHLLRADEPAWARLLAEIDVFLAAEGA